MKPPGFSRSKVVFPGGNGSTAGDDRPLLTCKRKALASALKTAGVDPTGVTLHTFRHGFISALADIPTVT